MHLHVNQLLAHYGYLGVFFILLVEMVGIPFPAETTLTIAGFEWTKGVFSLLPLLTSAVVGNVIGSTIAYSIGYFLGRPVILRFGRFVGITERKLGNAEERFNKYRTPIVLASKFIAGIRVLVPYLAGINRMPFWLFTLYNAISALAWAAFFITMGRYAGVAWVHYHRVLRKYIWVIIILVVIVAGYYVARKAYRRRKRK